MTDFTVLPQNLPVPLDDGAAAHLSGQRVPRLEDDDLRRYAAALALDLDRFDSDRASPRVLDRIHRDTNSGLTSGEVRGTPTLSIDGVVYRDSYDAADLLEALAE